MVNGWLITMSGSYNNYFSYITKEGVFYDGFLELTENLTESSYRGNESLFTQKLLHDRISYSEEEGWL